MLKLLLTCEHGGNQIPETYASLFEGSEKILRTHEGYDIGALSLFKELEPLADKTFYSETSRLLVELNRSLHHAKLFSDMTRDTDDETKAGILKQYYFPYREQVEHLVDDFVMAGRQVLHIAVHTFTPELNGEIRETDIGLLYDPKRKPEQTICRAWKQQLQQQAEKFLVRFNYPYIGISDGFPTFLRRKYTEDQYVGIELEVNQKFAQGEDNTHWNELKEALYISLRKTLAPYQVDTSEEE